MNIHILKTPEVDLDTFNSVVNFLSSFEGPLTFNISYYEFTKEDFYFLEYHLYPYHPFQYPSNDTAMGFSPGRGYPLSWRELFSMGNFYRELFRIEDDAYVVLLTKRKNALNWFSASDQNNNIFVHAADWELYTTVNPKYPIAYQVLENVLQELMKADIYNAPNEYIHESPRGCMNDLCTRKQEIIIKLQTGNICADCITKIRSEGASEAMIRQIINIFSSIRNEFIFQAQNKPVAALPLVIDNKGCILLPNQQLEIRLSILYKTLYLFLLRYPQGKTLVQLSDYNKELMGIYRRLRPSASIEDAKKRIFNLTHPSGGGFNPTKTRINKTITDLLGANLSAFYKISGSAGQPYFISIPRNIVDIRY